MSTVTTLSPTNYYTVAGWMLTDLGLRGNELTAYAVIYGFSQVTDHRFHGSVRYLADWMGVSPKTAERCLKSLVEQGLLLKYDKEVNGVKFCEYAAVPPSMDNHGWHTPCQIDGTPTVKLTDNNIDNSYIPPVSISCYDKYRDKADTYTQPLPNFNLRENKHDADIPPTGESGGGKEQIPYAKIAENYNALCPSLPKCRLLTDKRRRAIKSRFAEGFTAETLCEVFRKAEASDFLKGGGGRGFVASFDFLIGDKAAKVLEGAYDNGKAEQPTDPQGGGTRGYLTDEEFDELFPPVDDPEGE